MKNHIQVFDNNEFGKLEVLMIDGQPYFPATECAAILGYSRPHNAVERHCRYSLKRGVPHPQNPDKTIEVNFIPECDLYRLIMRSKLPAAERFEKFVVETVLPSIRKHGAYMTDSLLDEVTRSQDAAQDLFARLQSEKNKNSALLDKVERLAPKARYYDTILQCENTVQTSIIAKDYGMSCVAFNKLLNGFGIQYKIGGTWLLRAKYAGEGYTVTRTYYVSDKTASIHTYWTQRGRLFLYDFLKWYGIPPLAERTGAMLMGGDDNLS